MLCFILGRFYPLDVFSFTKEVFEMPQEVLYLGSGFVKHPLGCFIGEGLAKTPQYTHSWGLFHRTPHRVYHFGTGFTKCPLECFVFREVLQKP